MATLLNRADILACLQHYPADSLDEFAVVLGFDVLVPKTAKQMELSAAATSISRASADLTTASDAALVKLLRVVKHQQLEQDDIQPEEPAWYREAVPFQGSDPALHAPKDKVPPPQPVLMSKNRLWPFLKRALGEPMSGQQPDWPRVVEQLANAQVLRRLPKVRHKGWARQAQLIIDYDESLVPFWQDFNQLLNWLKQLRGQVGLTVLAFPHGDPGGVCWQDTPSGWRSVPCYRSPPTGTPVLILSDLGCNETSEQRRSRWRRFGQRLAQAGCWTIALMPSPPRWWDADLAQWFIRVYWDRAVRPPQQLKRNSMYAEAQSKERDANAATELLAALGTAVRIEPALLRAARYVFPAEAMDVGVEYAAWNHLEVQQTLLACYFRHADAYKQRFQDSSQLTPRLKQQLATLQAHYHAHLSPVIGYEEQLAAAALGDETAPDRATTFAARLAKTLGESSGEMQQLSLHWLQRMSSRQHASVWQQEALAVAWIKAQVSLDLSSVPLPEGLNPENYPWALKTQTSVKKQLQQVGHTLYFTEIGAVDSGSLVGKLMLDSDRVQVEKRTSTGVKETSWHRIAQPISINECDVLTIRSGREQLMLEGLILPDWASAFGRDAFGLYAALELQGITQRFRWINPGSFLMGSPTNEPERSNNEQSHQVTLTEGYWLADTACTQALWTAVMGDNPSHFKEHPDNPVETVSWEDAQQFMRKLNKLLPELFARLPTEAEWEYACRAGTLTPFAFGETITPEQVNYNGNYPYASGTKGAYREKTVPVESLPVNPWGLYEMHGNVWEWCAVWYGDYPVGAVTDPVGLAEGADRVLRGGSWFNNARSARSAYRFRYTPDFRDGIIGFRLALGRTGLSPEQPAAGRGTVAGRQDASERGQQAGHRAPPSKGNQKKTP